MYYICICICIIYIYIRYIIYIHRHTYIGYVLTKIHVLINVIGLGN